ncbi:MAG: hypothetical protein U0269_26395 [Polyangiales bacterium]
MKRIALLLTVLASLTGCASTASNTVAMAGITGHGRAVGTQGSTVARTNDAVAINTHDESERVGREVRGIPTPQPVREPSMAAHAIPVPQPPIPMPPHGGGFAARYP